jgi:peroxiredoxin
MLELGQLEKHYQDFASRKVRVVAVSNDELNDAKTTQDKFQHLVIASDPQMKMAQGFAVIHEHMAPGGKDTNVPTTFLIDTAGNVRWLFRSDSFIVRLPPKELLTAIDGALK